MLNDIIEQFMKSKNMTNFDFSLRPNHDIDNPFAKTSMDIIDRLQQSIEKADKSVLGDVLIWSILALNLYIVLMNLDI